VKLEPLEHDDLEWLAFRYVAGEMEPAEALRFEGRLADDHAARDAVCHAVALTERLTAASPQEVDSGVPEPLKVNKVARRPRRVLQALGWMSVGAAAAVAGILLARPGFVVRPSASDPTAGGARPVANAVVWARLQTASQWADEQDERYLEEADLPMPVEDTAIEPMYPSPTWLHVTDLQKRVMP
jgi:anti-sigma factor RsiW